MTDSDGAIDVGLSAERAELARRRTAVSTLTLGVVILRVADQDAPPGWRLLEIAMTVLSCVTCVGLSMRTKVPRQGAHAAQMLAMTLAVLALTIAWADSLRVSPHG